MPAPTNVIPEFHVRLRRARELRGLSQRELADLVGIGERTLRAWESGDTRPSHRGLRLIADAMGVRLGSLLAPAEWSGAELTGAPSTVHAPRRTHGAAGLRTVLIVIGAAAAAGSAALSGRPADQPSRPDAPAIVATAATGRTQAWIDGGGADGAYRINYTLDAREAPRSVQPVDVSLPASIDPRSIALRLGSDASDAPTAVITTPQGTWWTRLGADASLEPLTDLSPRGGNASESGGSLDGRAVMLRRRAAGLA